MLTTAVKTLKHWFNAIKEARRDKQRKIIAERAEIEERERKALVKELTKKFALAHADCEQNNKPFTNVELSVKEISFIEGELGTWNRYFKEHEIYKPMAHV